MLEEVVFQRQSRVFEFLASRVHQIGGFPVFLSGRRICDGNLITHGSEIGTGEEVVLTHEVSFFDAVHRAIHKKNLQYSPLYMSFRGQRK